MTDKKDTIYDVMADCGDTNVHREITLVRGDIALGDNLSLNPEPDEFKAEHIIVDRENPMMIRRNGTDYKLTAVYEIDGFVHFVIEEVTNENQSR